MCRISICVVLAAALPAFGDVIQNPGYSPINGFVPFMGSGSGANLGPFPSSFDLQNDNGNDYVTSVKNQGALGTCWAFAVYGAMESDILMAGGPVCDFSENNLVNHVGFNPPMTVNDGGDEDMAIAYMSNLNGPGNESDDPYVGYDNHLTDPVSIPRQYFLENCNFYTTMGAMKNALMTQGAICTDLYFDFGGSFNSTNDTYYYSGNQIPNHAVTIVGWNDSIVTAGGTGAWLCKNSWGTSWGNNGYFWLSYQDNIGGKYGASFTMAPPNTVGSVYTYAPHGEVGVVNTPYSCSVFQTTSAARLNCVGFYTQQDGANYDLRIYHYWTAGNSPSGLLAQATGTETYQGLSRGEPALAGEPRRLR